MSRDRVTGCPPIQSHGNAEYFQYYIPTLCFKTRMSSANEKRFTNKYATVRSDAWERINALLRNVRIRQRDLTRLPNSRSELFPERDQTLRKVLFKRATALCQLQFNVHAQICKLFSSNYCNTAIQFPFCKRGNSIEFTVPRIRAEVFGPTTAETRKNNATSRWGKVSLLSE